MATPNVGILTTAGKALIDKVNSGQAKISFSKIVFSSMDNSQLSDTQIKALTAIVPQEVVVSSPETTLDTNSGETRIRATGTNEKLADGVYVKTYGVFAKDDAGNEILYGVTVSPNPNYFPAYDGVTPQAVTYSYKTVIQETSNITMTNSNDVYASQEDLTEALQPYAKTVDVNQQLDKKVVDNHDGTEQLNGVQVQPFNKLSDTIGGRNLLIGTSGTLQIAPDSSDKYDGGTVYKFSTAEIANTSGKMLTLRVYIHNTSSSPVEVVFFGTDSGFTIGPEVAANSDGYSTVTISSPSSSDKSRDISIRAYNANASISGVEYKELKLGQCSVATDWTPAPEDKVNVSDMRKPASDVAGIEEVNVKQDKIGYTPADDSKVVHNTGTEEIAGTKTFDTAPIDKTTGNPYITKDGVPAVPSTLADTTKPANFTAGLQSGGVDVATAADIKSIEDASWHTITGKSDALSAYTCLYRKNNEKKYVDLVLYGTMGITMDTSSSYTELLDLSEIISTPKNAEGGIACPQGASSGGGVSWNMSISGTKLLFSWMYNNALLYSGKPITSVGNDLNSPFLRVTFD